MEPPSGIEPLTYSLRALLGCLTCGDAGCCCASIVVQNTLRHSESQLLICRRLSIGNRFTTTTDTSTDTPSDRSDTCRASNETTKEWREFEETSRLCPECDGAMVLEVDVQPLFGGEEVDRTEIGSNCLDSACGKQTYP